MSRDHRPAAENVRYLKQGIELIRDLEDRFWSAPDEAPGAGVGGQFRHCIDFYSCFLQGLAQGKIDYNERERDRRIEVDRATAIKGIEELIRQMDALETDPMDEPIEVSLEQPQSAPARSCGSTVLRELQFLLSHTVHHFALIAIMLQLRGYQVGEPFTEFGVAPSTLSYWKKTGSKTA